MTRAKNTLLDGLNEPKTRTYTVKELRQIAKDRGLKGYSKLRKQELLDLVFPTSLLDERYFSTTIYANPTLNHRFFNHPCSAKLRMSCTEQLKK